MKMNMHEYAEKCNVSYWTIRRAVLSGRLKADTSQRIWYIADSENKHVDIKINTGVSKHPLYGKWVQMRNRCQNPNHKEYKWYGGKGVIVCKEWDSDFKCFLKWAKDNGHQQGLSLDRINPNGNYCPENCRWATAKEQGETRTNNKSPKTPLSVAISQEEQRHLKAMAQKQNVSVSAYVRQLIVSDMISSK